MKPAKAILAILATFGATAASAATVVHITGSTAYRGQVSKAILASFDAGTVNVAGIGGAALSKSNQSFYHGTMGGTDTIIETDWTGSVGGVNALVTNSGLNFFPDNTDTAGTLNYQAVTVPVSGNDVTLGAGNNAGNTSTGVYKGYYLGLNSAVADIAMSDTFQSSTIYTSPKLTGATITIGSGPATTKEIVGVVPFTWVRSAAVDQSALNITNVAPQQLNILFGAGSVPASLFTGSTTDAATPVYAFGRDPESGTRLTAFAETGLGANATVIQYLPSDGSTTQSAQITTAPVVYGPVTVTDLGLTFTGGNGGEASGGNLGKYLSRQFQSGLGCAISYLSTGDATTAINGTNASGNGFQGGAAFLNYCGVGILSTSGTGQTVTTNLAPIQNGSYTFWGYEHMLYAPAIGTAQKTIGNKIASAIYNTTAAVFLSSMNVSRPGDGGQVSN